MRSSFATAFAFVATLSTSNAIVLEERGTESRALHLPIQRRHVENPVERDQKRHERRASDTLGVELDNLNTLYIADASLGTPEQKLRLHIDTGSSDLWVNTPDSSRCSRNDGKYCKTNGVYSANDSSSYTYVNSEFQITYVDGSGAAGDYATDTLHIGDATIQNMQFGIGYKSSSPEGILGIGYTTNEAQVVRGNSQPYQNLPAKLVSAGTINAQAYSLWLNDLDASTGSILFGGVDTYKYHGKLQTLPIIKEQGEYREFVIAMTSMGLNGKPNAIFSNNKVPVLLDSGSSLTYLPNTVAATLYKAAKARYDSQQGAAVVDCDLANEDDTIDFSFSGVEIKVPLNEMVLEIGSYNNKPVCVFGISPSGSSTAVLGDTFLRSAYVVYDLGNNQISLAQTNYNATGTKVMDISSGSDGVPDAKGVPNAVASAAVSGGGARNGLPNGISGTGSGAASTSTPGAAAHARGPYDAAKAAGAGIGAAWLAALLAA